MPTKKNKLDIKTLTISSIKKLTYKEYSQIINQLYNGDVEISKINPKIMTALVERSKQFLELCYEEEKVFLSKWFFILAKTSTDLVDKFIDKDLHVKLDTMDLYNLTYSLYEIAKFISIINGTYKDDEDEQLMNKAKLQQVVEEICGEKIVNLI